jgi:hypothetical protein
MSRVFFWRAHALRGKSEEPSAICQGTRKYAGASWTHQFGKRKQIRCSSCKRLLEAPKWVAVVA